MPFFQLSPVADQGLKESTPSSLVKWRKLTNVIQRDGALRSRAGFVEVPGAESNDLTGQLALGTPVALIEISNPGGVTEGRDNFTYAQEQLRPSSTVSNSGWSGTGGGGLHDDVNEPGVSDGEVIFTSTEGSVIFFGFPAVGISNDKILGGTIKGRVRVTKEGRVRLGFYEDVVSTDSLFDFLDINASVEDFGEAGIQFLDFAIPFTRPPSGGDLFFNLGIRMESGFSDTRETLIPTGDGAATDWENVVDETTAAFSDIDGNVFDLIIAKAEDFIKSRTGGAQQLFTFDAPTISYDTIDNLAFSLTWSRHQRELDPTNEFAASLVLPPSVEGEDITLNFIYRNAGGTVFTVGSTTLAGNDLSKFDVVLSDENPDTSAPWVAADITSGQFGIELVGDQANDAWVHVFNVGILGEESGGIEVQIDIVNIDVLTVEGEAEADDYILGKDKIMVTDRSYLQWQGPGPNPGFVDVGGGVGAVSTGGIPLDHAILYGQTYVVSGQEATRRYPTPGGVFEALGTNNGASFITGKSVVAFADRVMYGWTNDDGTITPERISFSNFQDGGDHSGTSGGDLDLLDTPGGIGALGVLTEDFCTAIKDEKGIYLLRRTGNSRIPFIRDVVDFETGIVAPRTLKTGVSTSGAPIQFFLGKNPTKGLNVFAFDGGSAQAIGDDIRPFLRDDVNDDIIGSFAFGEIDGEGQLYWLFLPEDDQLYAFQGFVMSMKTGQWYRFESPFHFTCSGRWTLAPADVSLACNGKDSMVVGTKQGLPYFPDYASSGDSVTPAAEQSSPVDGENDFWVANTLGRLKKFFTSTLETGDLILNPNEPNKQVQSNRIFIGYRDRGPVRVKVSASVDGGKEFNIPLEHNIGTIQGAGTKGKDDTGYYIAKLDYNAVHGYRHRIKIEFEPSVLTDDDFFRQQMSLDEQIFQVEEAWIEWEPMGDAP